VRKARLRPTTERGHAGNEESSRRLTEKTADLSKRAEAQMVYQASLLANVHDAIIATDADFNVTAWNPAAAQLYGWKSDEVMGRWVTEVIRPEMSCEVRAEAIEIVNRVGGYESEIIHHRRDGTPVWVHAHTITLRDEAGRITGYVSVNRDITKRKRAEEALRQSEERFRRYFELGLIGMAITSPAKGFTEVNDHLCDLLGYDRQELLRLTWLELTHPDDMYADLTEFNRAMAGEIDGYSIDKRFIRKDGQVIHATIAVSCLRGPDGAVDYFMALLQDITERQRAEEQLKNSNEALHALAARLQAVREEESLRIAREIHDDLGSALTALKIDLAWINKRLARTRNEAVRERLKRMADLIDETAQKVRSIATELRPSLLDHLGLAAAIEWQTKEFERRTEIKCRIVSLAEDVALEAEKAIAVFRIFQEILTNIARHSQATLVKISLEAHDEIVLHVTDNGRGIRPSDLSASDSLGLLGMRERAMVFNGRVDITSAERQGTTVTVRIPRVIRLNGERGEVE
jgi:PAS domain S-box-containing protein